MASKCAKNQMQNIIQNQICKINHEDIPCIHKTEKIDIKYDERKYCL